MNQALPRLHAVTDDRIVTALGAAGLVSGARALAGAAGPLLAVQLRTRALAGGALLGLARQLASVLAPHGAWLLINDRADAARAAGAKGVVSGTGGLGVSDIRSAAPGLLVGRSVHDRAEIREAAEAGADFLVAGSVYVTPTHPDRAPGGAALVRAAAEGGRQVVAIGGITPERAADVVAAGAWGVAAIRALWDAPDRAAAAAAFLSQLPRDDTLGVVVNGEARRARRGITLLALLDDLSLDPRAVVVEHNRRIVRREQLAAIPLLEGDCVELVHFVGGG